MSTGNTVADRQSQPGSLARRPGREEGIENPAQVFRRDAAAVIADGKANHRVIAANIFDDPASYPDFPGAFIDGQDGISQHVGQEALKLPGVGVDAWQLGVGGACDLDALGLYFRLKGMKGAVQNVADICFEKNHFFVVTEDVQVIDDLDASGSCFFNSFKPLGGLDGFPVVKQYLLALSKNLNSTKNATDRIVQFMGRAMRHAGNGRHFFGSYQLDLGVLQLPILFRDHGLKLPVQADDLRLFGLAHRDVPPDQMDACQFIVFLLKADIPFHRNFPPVLGSEYGLHESRLLPGGQAGDRCHESFPAGRVDNVGDVQAGNFPVVVAQMTFPGRIAVKNAAVRRNHLDHVTDVFKKIPVALFALLQFEFRRLQVGNVQKTFDKMLFAANTDG